MCVSPLFKHTHVFINSITYSSARVSALCYCPAASSLPSGGKLSRTLKVLFKGKARSNYPTVSPSFFFFKIQYIPLDVLSSLFAFPPTYPFSTPLLSSASPPCTNLFLFCCANLGGPTRHYYLLRRLTSDSARHGRHFSFGFSSPSFLCLQLSSPPCPSPHSTSTMPPSHL